MDDALCADSPVYMCNSVFSILHHTLNLEGESVPSLLVLFAELSCRTQPPSMTSPLDWTIQHLPSMNLFPCLTRLQARFKVAVIFTCEDSFDKSDPLFRSHICSNGRCSLCRSAPWPNIWERLISRLGPGLLSKRDPHISRLLFSLVSRSILFWGLCLNWFTGRMTP